MPGEGDAQQGGCMVQVPQPVPTRRGQGLSLLVRRHAGNTLHQQQAVTQCLGSCVSSAGGWQSRAERGTQGGIPQGWCAELGWVPSLG